MRLPHLGQGTDTGRPGLADVEAGAGEGTYGVAAAVVGDGDDGVEPGHERRQGEHRRHPAVEPGHDRPVRARHLDDVAGVEGDEAARRRDRLDAEDVRPRTGGPARSEVGDGGGPEGADTEGHDDDVDGGPSTELLELRVELGEDRRVALDDPRGTSS